MSIASMSTAGVINRCNKTGTGTTAFGDLTTIEASEFNCDFDALYTLVNAQLDNDNIASGAAIALSKLNLTDAILNAHINSAANILFSKMLQTPASGVDGSVNGLDADIIDDYSQNDTEQAITTDPGTSDNSTLATNLEEEIAQLRYKIEQLTIGASTTIVSAAAATGTNATWMDGPVRPWNMVKNGGFDVWTAAANAAGDGWALELTPDTATTSKSAGDDYGEGKGILITGNGGATEGIKQTLDALKASTRYLARVAVKPTAGDSCRLVTTGADTNQLSVDTAADNAFEVIAGTFETDGTPTDVILKLVAVADGDICLFDDAAVMEINADPVPRGPKIHCYDSTNTAGEDFFNIAATLKDTALTCSVTPPGPNWMITVNAKLHAENGGTGQDGFVANLYENCGSKIIVDQHGSYAAAEDPAGPDMYTDTTTASLFHINDSPTPGTTCTYTMEGTGVDGVFHLNDFNDDTPGAYDPITFISVTMEPTG